MAACQAGSWRAEIRERKRRVGCGATWDIGTRRAVLGAAEGAVAVASAEALIACEALILATRQVEGGITFADRTTVEVDARRRGLGGARVGVTRSGTEAFMGCKAGGLATRQIDGGITSSIEDERSERPASLWAEDQWSS